MPLPDFPGLILSQLFEVVGEAENVSVIGCCFPQVLGEFKRPLLRETRLLDQCSTVPALWDRTGRDWTNFSFGCLGGLSPEVLQLGCQQQYG